MPDGSTSSPSQNTYPTSVNSYDANGNLKKVELPLPNTVPNGRNTPSYSADYYTSQQYEYDRQNRVIRQKTTENGGDGSTDRTSQTHNYYDGNGNRTYTVGPLDNNGDPLTSTTQGYSGYDKTNYDKANRVTETFDTRAIKSYDDKDLGLAKDPSGNITAKSDPPQAKTTRTLDKDGNVKQTTDPEGAVTEFGFDDVGRTVSSTRKDVTVPSGTRDEKSTTTYDTAGLVLSTTTPEQNAQQNPKSKTYKYDDASRQTGVVDELGNESHTDYDASGNVKKSYTPEGYAASNQYWRENKYDRMGRKVNDRVLREDGSGGTNTIVPYRTSDTEFTDNGQVKREYDRVNSGSGENWEYSYDLQGRRTQVKDPKVDDPSGSGTIRYTEDYTYGFAGNLLETEDRIRNIIRCRPRSPRVETVQTWDMVDTCSGTW